MSFFDTPYLEFRDSLTEMDSRFRGNDGRRIGIRRPKWIPASASARTCFRGNDGRRKSNASR